MYLKLLKLLSSYNLILMLYNAIIGDKTKKLRKCGVGFVIWRQKKKHALFADRRLLKKFLRLSTGVRIAIYL